MRDNILRTIAFTLLAAACLAALLVLGRLAGEALGFSDGAVLRIDVAAQDAIGPSVSDATADTMRAITSLGGLPAMAGILVALAILALILRRPAVFLIPAAASAGGEMLSENLKDAIGRPRPSLEQLVPQGGYAYPSGHTLHAVALYGGLVLVAIMLARREDRLRVGLIAAIPATIIAFAVGVSRAVLGVHFASDVIASWILGALWLTALLPLALSWARRDAPTET